MKKVIAYTMLFGVAGMFPVLGACYEREAASLNASELGATQLQPDEAAAQVAAVTQRFPQFENANVAVWKTVIAPNQPLNMHRHDNGRVIVALKGGTLKILPEHGEPYSVTWETGTAYWLDADPPGQLHGDLNEGPGNIEVMVIEMRP